MRSFLPFAALLGVAFRGGRVGQGDADPTQEQLELLFNQLLDGFQERNQIWVSLPREDGVFVGSSGGGNLVQFAYPNENPEDGSTIHSFQFRVLGPGVNGTGDINGMSGLTLVFTGGSIRLGASTGNTPSGFNLTCPNDFDVITMILKSQ